MVKFKESESESDGTEHAAEPRFRVRVCMQRFYGDDDVRARAYVCVAPRRRVRWLQRRLRRLFALPPVRLLSRGHLLPPQEPLALLQPDDPVEVVPAEAEPDDTAAARDLVHSVDDAQVATVEERERLPPPVGPDDLTESKRQALSMLEQYYVEPAAGAAAGAPRAKRRRVRRRRRVTRAGSAATDADAEPAPAPGSSSAEAAPAPDSSPAEAAPAPGSSSAEEAPAPDRSSAEAAAMVLRNELQPRAPRVVRPLADRTTATSLDTPPAEIVTS